VIPYAVAVHVIPASAAGVGHIDIGGHT